MSNSDENRWRQRLANFEKIMARFDAACDIADYTDLERAGLIKTFEFSFELAWKTLKDLLFYEGYEESTPRGVWRRAFEASYIDEATAETALDALDKRNLLTHTYNEETAEEATDLITEQYAPMLREILEALQARRDAR
ncbi:MAG: nucleotidyltransferase substrate binding protein [Deltaproteobacteria bacterium]|nr:nucleotidyltransferase substrate binding protein [Deltaproteobacteria bacterium]